MDPIKRAGTGVFVDDLGKVLWGDGQFISIFSYLFFGHEVSVHQFLEPFDQEIDVPVDTFQLLISELEEVITSCDEMYLV